MARETKPSGGYSERAPAYDVGELDLASTPLELGGAAENQQRPLADDDAHFYASLPTSAAGRAPPTREHDSDHALWADLPSLELAHDPRDEGGAQSVRRPSPVPSVPAPLATRAGSEEAPASSPLPELGLAPNALWETPLYALRAGLFAIGVWRARSALQREHAHARVALDHALSELGAALLAQRDRPELGPLQGKFVSIDEKRTQRASVVGALGDLEASRAAQTESLDAELARIHEELAPFVQRADAAHGVLRQAELDQSRADAQAKRAEIALRAAKQASSLPAGTSLDELDRALLERRTELGHARDTRGRAQSLRDDARAELEQRRSAERSHDQKRTSLATEADKRASALGKRVELVGVSEAAALRSLGLAARELKVGDCARGASEAADKQARFVSAIEADLARVADALSAVRGQSVLQGASLCFALLLAIYWFL